MKEPLAYFVKKLLKNNKIGINEDELEFQLLSHPTYPSLHAITGVLDHFSVKNFALEIPRNIETFNLLPNSFLAFVKDDIYNGLVLINKQNQGCQLSFDDKKKTMLSASDFVEVWTGIVVIIDEENQKFASESKKKYFTDRNIIIVLVSFLAILFLYKTTLFPAIHFLLSVAGLAICILILNHELGISSKMLDKFCSKESKKTSCDAVLNSKGANLFGFLKLSDVGIIYFVSLILSWSLLKNNNTSNNSIILITLLALPFTFYSIFYQYKVAKKWCLLCLSVVLILWLQAISLYFSDFRFDNALFNLKSCWSLLLFCVDASCGRYKLVFL